MFPSFLLPDDFLPPPGGDLRGGRGWCRGGGGGGGDHLVRSVLELDMDAILPDSGELCPVRVDHGAEASPLVEVVFSYVFGSVRPLVHSLAMELSALKLPETLDFRQ